MKRLAMILAMLILLAGLVPTALAQGPSGQNLVSTSGAAASPEVAVSTVPDAVLYFWDFEGNNGGFASTLDWEWGTYAWVGNGCYNTNNTPPPAPYSGTDMWGSVLNTCYSDLGNNANPCANVDPNNDSILSFDIDLTGATAPITMTWWEWYDLFGSFDWAEVYANGSVVWQNCSSHVVPTAWVQQTVDLSPYAGGPVTIEFHMMASTVVNYAGWYIDDVMIAAAEQPPYDVWKEAPAEAYSGDVISYTIAVSTASLEPGMMITDVLPAGVEYAGNLSWTAGEATYSETLNAVLWTVPPPKTTAEPAVDATLGLPLPTGLPTTMGGPVPFGGGSTMEILDDFNRADGPIGAAWTVNDGYCNVSNNAAVCGSFGRATFNSAPGDGDVAEVDVATNGAVLQYAGLLLDYGVGATNLFLKVQDNDSVGQFTHGGCYIGNNVNGFGLGFFTLDAPFSTAHMRATRVGDDVTIEFTNIDGGGGTQTYLCTGAPAREGTGIGILGYGGIARMDNFGLPGSAPEPIQITFDVTVTALCGETVVNQGVFVFEDTTIPFDASTYILGEPDIEVDAPPLGAELCPDATEVITFSICNVGTCELDWEIQEQTRTLRLASVGNPGLDLPIYEGVSSAGPAPADKLPGDVPLSQPIVPLGTLAYSIEAANGFWTGFDLDVPEVLPNLGAIVTADFPGAGEYIDDYVYVADVANNLYQVDPATGAILSTIPITPPPGAETYSGMALDPTSGVVYASSTDVSTSHLLTVDVATGVATQIGEITGSPATIAIAVDGSGQLWGYDIVNDVFMAIDKATGAGTVIGPIGFNANFGQGLGWDPATDQVYMAAFNNDTFQPELRIVDVGTGGTTLVGVLGSTTPGGTCQLPFLAVPLDVEPPPPPVDIPWLSEAPISGTIPPGECTVVDVTFDATGIYTPGDYLADLLILSNDPVEPVVTLPVTMTVLEAVDIVDVIFDITDLTVAFTPTVTGDEPIDYMWDLGDGAMSTETNPIHTYDAGGCYSVSLDVANECGLDSWVGEVCVVAPCDPVHDADFTWMPMMPVVDGMVYFTGTVATGTPPFYYTWDFGDTGTGSGMNVTHTFVATGTFTVTLTVTNTCGVADVAYAVTVVEPEPEEYAIYLPIIVRP